MPDWEVELGIVIGQRTSYLEYLEDAPGALAGFRVVNDLSERAFQLERTPDEIDDVLSLDMWLDLGLQRQHVLGPR